MIALLLRRGADPSMSDWPLPCLALAVRAGDLKMVQLLMKKRAQVNCQLDVDRHANLTPLHIACGCLEPTAVDIARVLLENGAHVNAESQVGNKEYFTFLDPAIKAVKTNVLSVSIFLDDDEVFPSERQRRTRPNTVAHRLYARRIGGDVGVGSFALGIRRRSKCRL